MDIQDILNIRESYLEVYNIQESHFSIGDEVICKKSGMEGEVVKVDKDEKGKYYTVKREDGKKVKYAPDELKMEDENEGASKKEESKFHKNLDTLVHKTFGKRPEEEMKEQVDNYDIILSHLLDEGYVETLEAAEVIMVNMSEEWRDSILLEKKRQYDDGHGFDRSKHPDLEIDYDRPRGKDQNKDIRGYTRISHKPSGITYEINHDKKHGIYNMPSDLKGKARKAHGHKPEHDIRWSHDKEIEMNRKGMSKSDRIKTARNAKRVWDQHIQHRIPSGHLVSNSPDDNPGDNRRNPDKNTRASIYQRSGFGKPNLMGKQYSTKIGKKLHPVNDDED